MKASSLSDEWARRRAAGLDVAAVDMSITIPDRKRAPLPNRGHFTDCPLLDSSKTASAFGVRASCVRACRKKQAKNTTPDCSAYRCSGDAPLAKRSSERNAFVDGAAGLRGTAPPLRTRVVDR